MKHPKLLIVEGDVTVAQELQKRLMDLGYDIAGIESTGDGALKKAIAVSPDLILIDVRLTGAMDGIETASILRFQHGMAIVYLSAFADNDTLNRATTSDPFGFILEPFEDRELHAAIEMALYRKELERKIKETLTWYGTILQNIEEAVISTDASGAVIFMNTAAERLTGWKMNDVLGKNVLNVFQSTEKSEYLHWMNPVDQILKNKISTVLKHQAILISRDRTEIPIDESVSPMKDELGNTVGVVIVCKDVSDRTQDQDTLKTSQEYAQSILESSLDMVVAVDLERHIVEFNRAAERTFGYEKEEVLGKHIDLLYAHPDAGTRVNRKVSELGREVTEIWNKRKNGEVFPCLLSSSILQNSRGEKIGYMGMSRDISDIAKSDERLQAAQEYAQSIIHSSLDMIIAVDKNLDIIEFNKAAEETYGYSLQELQGRPVSILYTDPEESKKVYETTVVQGRYVHEVIGKRKNGEVFQSLLSSSVLRDAKGNMIGVMGVSRDITEKNRADQALRESEERYRSLVEISPDPIAVHVGGTLVFVNTAAVHMFAAASPDDLIGRSIMELVHPEYRILVKERVLQMATHDVRVPTIEEKFVRLDGTTFKAEVAAMPFLWHGTSAIQVVLRDLTDRIKAEQAIRGSEAKYRSLVENVLDGVYQTTPEGEILTANPALARMLGYSSETDLLLLNVEKELYVNIEDRSRFIRFLNTEGRIKNAEFKLRRKDGQIIDVLENARAVRNRTGDILYYEGTITDITELKKAQVALQISEERFRAFIEQSTDAIWCIESPEPMSIRLTEERQIKYLMEVNYLTECNDTMARRHGAETADQLLGAKLKELLDPSDPANIEFLRSFIRSSYQLVNYASHQIDMDGNSKYYVYNMVGVVEGERLVRVWGTLRDITVEKQAALLKSIFFRVAQVQGGDQTLDDLYKEVHQLVQEVMPNSNLSIALYDKEKNLLNFPYYVDEVDRPPPPRKLGRGLFEYVLRNSKSLLCTPTVYRELQNRGELVPVEEFSKVWLGVPLMADHRNIGVLAVQDYQHANRYSKEQQTILEFLSNQIAKAILQKWNVTALKQKEQRYHDYIEVNPHAHFIARPDGTVSECNPAFLHLMDFETNRDLTGARFNILGSTKMVQANTLKRIKKSAGTLTVDMKFKTASRKLIPAKVHYGATLDSSGVLVQIHGFVVPKRVREQRKS
jgi:PAS domain S-box-containing protein